MVCITVIHFISLFLLDMEIHLFLILSIILYISDWPLLKKICKRQKCCFFSKEIFADMYFCGLCTKAMNKNNPRVGQPINGERKHSTPHSRAPLVHESESHHLWWEYGQCQRTSRQAKQARSRNASMMWTPSHVAYQNGPLEGMERVWPMKTKF